MSFLTKIGIASRPWWLLFFKKLFPGLTLIQVSHLYFSLSQFMKNVYVCVYVCVHAHLLFT